MLDDDLSELDDLAFSLLQAKEKELNNCDVEKKLQLTSSLEKYLVRRDSSLSDDYSSLIPIDFELFDDGLKLKVLEECLTTGVNIEDSKTFNSHIEGVYTEKELESRGTTKS